MPQATKPQISVLTADHFIGKSFTLTDTGEIRKTSAATFSRGTAARTAAPSAEALGQVLEGLQTGQALTLGTLADGRAHARLTTIGQLREGDSRVARSNKHFTYAAGPGWLALDYDEKQMPEAVRERVAELGGIRAAWQSIWPEIEGAARVFRASSSGGVRKADAAPGDAAGQGMHGYVLISDQRDTKPALEALQARAWAAGLGWIMLSANGQALVRSIVDVAVAQPERIFFEAPPILGPGLVRDPAPILYAEGDAVAAPLTAPDVSDLIAAAKAEIKPEAERVERRATAERRAQRKAAGQTDAQIERAEELAAGGILDDDAPIYDRNGAQVRVGDVLDGLRRGESLGLPDPYEGPSYGLDKATLRWDRRFDSPVLISHAHGQRTIWRFARYEAAQVAPIDITPATLPSKRTRDLVAALARVTGPDDAGVVLAVGYALLNRVPAAMGIEDVEAWLIEALPEDARAPLGPILRRIMARLRQALDMRKGQALAPVSITRQHDTLTRELVAELAPLDQVDGVTLIRAPMASGKTQRIGAPFVRKAKARRASVAAVCHRQALTEELAQRLDLGSYRGAGTHDGVAICSPSLTLDRWQAMRPEYLFLDEIGQVLRFLTAQHHCRTKDGTARDVYRRLRALVQGARGVVACDAGADDAVVDFLAMCRPDDPIRLIEMPAPEDAGIAADFATGTMRDVEGHVADRLADELRNGGKVWLAVESATRAEAVAAWLAEIPGKRVLCVTADEKHSEAQARFLADPDTVSRQYDAVIASPVISSGLSIEHRGAPHFTLGGFVGSGAAIAPSDAAQMLRRVRYLTRFVIGCGTDNRVGAGLRAEDALKGRAAAAATEGAAVLPSGFDDLVEHFRAESRTARAGFANGLWWQLEAAGWGLTRKPQERTSAPAKLADQREAVRTARVAALVEASAGLGDLTGPDVREMKLAQPDRARRAVIEAWEMTRALGCPDLSAADVDFADQGGAAKLDLFEDFLGIGGDELTEDDFEASLSHRRLRVARRKHLREIFGDDLPAEVILGPDSWLTPDAAKGILDRVMAKAAEYAASGAVPPRYAARFGAAAPKRPKYEVRAVAEMLGRMGIRTMGGGQVRVREVSQMGPASLEQAGGMCDSAGQVVRIYGVNQDDVAHMRLRHGQREEMRRHGCHPAHIAAAKELIAFTDSCALAAGQALASVIPWGFGPIRDVVRTLRPDLIAAQSEAMRRRFAQIEARARGSTFFARV